MLLKGKARQFCKLSNSRSVHGIGEFPQSGVYKNEHLGPQDYTARNQQYFMVSSSGIAGLAMAKNTVGSFVSTLMPNRGLMAVANVEINLDDVPEGRSVTMDWRGKPLFVRHREQWEIDEAANVDMSELKDPETDASRAPNPEFLIVIGICTHLGCVPLGQKGLYKGWFCPCHGSHYDTSGRIRAGPAPANLPVPPYRYLTERKGNVIVVGE